MCSKATIKTPKQDKLIWLSICKTKFFISYLSKTLLSPKSEKKTEFFLFHLVYTDPVHLENLGYVQEMNLTNLQYLCPLSK